MKLIVCITAFDGLEILPRCLSNYELFADKIIIFYQDISNTGIRDNVGEKLEQFRDRAELIKYDTIPNVPIKRNEIAKHNLMVQEAKKYGSHCIISATDHFYDVNQVRSVMEEASEYDTTFTPVINYFKFPTWQLTPIVPWRQPFIFKLSEDKKVERIANYPIHTDRACQISPIGKWKMFENVFCHNYAIVRDDVEYKMKNADLPLLWSTKKKQQIVDQYNSYDPSSGEPLLYYNYAKEGVTVKIVPNYFNL